MSLQVWLPLNGTIENKGLASEVKIYANSGEINNLGKIGKAYRFADNNLAKLSAASKDLFNNNAPFSLCSWVYLHSYPQTNYNGSGFLGDQLYFTEKSKGGYLGGGFGIQITYNDYASLRLATNTGGYDINFGKLSLNTWYHLCGTFDGNTAITYLNGKKIASLQNCGYTVNGQEFYLGCNTQGGWTHPFDNSLNDVRIYNHCLSPKEVKEISKGLCLHYRLSGHGCENLLSNSYDFKDWIAASNIVDTISPYQGAKSVKTNKCWQGPYINLKHLAELGIIKKGDTLTYSIYVKSDLDLNNCSFSCFRFTQKNDSFNVNKITLKKDIWQKFSYTFEVNDYALASDNARFEYNAPYDEDYYIKDGAHIYFALYKLEFGSAATPWTPNSSDSLYTTLGYNSFIEPDCSGFGNDGTKVGNISCDSDTPRYMTSYKFDSGKYINAGQGAKITDEVSISVWAYMDNWSSYHGRLFSCTEGGGWNIEYSNSYFNFPVYVQGIGYINCITSTKCSSLKSGWHHFVTTYDGLTSKFYIDGKLDASKVNGATAKTPISYNATNSIFLAAEAEANADTVSSGFFPGKLSDFRIYATALSADDVLDLYQTGASIDNGGNAWAYEYKEVE